MSINKSVIRIMKAIQVREFGGVDVLKYITDAPRPTPSSKQVLLRIGAIGVNPVETYIRAGAHLIKPTLPYVPGNDAAGIVEDIGPEVIKFKKGDRVYCVRTVTGSYAEYTVTDEATTFQLPSNIGFKEGAALGIPYFTAYRALIIKARSKAGETLLVHGASGAVGLACCQIGHAMGMRVFGTAGTKEGMDLILKNGAHEAFNHRQAGYADEILKSTDSHGIDVVAEMLANVNLETDLKLMKKFGRIITIGSRGSIEITPRLAMGKESQIIGVQLPSSTPEEYAEMAAFLQAGMEAGWVHPVIGLEYPLEKVAEAHIEVIEHKKGTQGKIILIV